MGNNSSYISSQGPDLRDMQGLGGVEVARPSVGEMCRMLRKLLGEK